jgi:3-(3-hydroxy-phenyl)propionate hydroxylase
VSGKPVVVVGAGPVGLITALGLVRRGVPVTIVDSEPAVVRSPRAMGYHWSSLYILADLGLLDDLIADGFTGQGLRLRVHRTGDYVDLSTACLQGSVEFPFSLTLGQDRMAEIVLEHLSRHEEVDVLWRTEMTEFHDRGDYVDVHAVGPDGPLNLQASWLVGADGASSRVRRQLAIEFDGMTWPTAFVATNVQADFLSLGYGPRNLLIDPEFGAVIAQITEDGLWRVAFSVDAAMPESQVDDAVKTYLSEITPAGFACEVRARSKYLMHQRAATTMRRGRVVLVGDSAHVTNPTSGFGLVGGMHDANILIEALAAVINGDISDDILDRYSSDRIAAFLEVSSPVSIASKELVFDLPDQEAIANRIKSFRAWEYNSEALFKFWQRGCYIETPSLLSGDLLSAGRNGLVEVAGGERAST